MTNSGALLGIVLGSSRHTSLWQYDEERPNWFAPMLARTRLLVGEDEILYASSDLADTEGFDGGGVNRLVLLTEQRVIVTAIDFSSAGENPVVSVVSFARTSLQQMSSDEAKYTADNEPPSRVKVTLRYKDQDGIVLPIGKFPDARAITELATIMGKLFDDLK
jgi:hypothetical protein